VLLDEVRMMIEDSAVPVGVAIETPDCVKVMMEGVLAAADSVTVMTEFPGGGGGALGGIPAFPG
jgi:pentose-5-phosphate-3-epimerase